MAIPLFHEIHVREYGTRTIRKFKVEAPTRAGLRELLPRPAVLWGREKSRQETIRKDLESISSLPEKSLRPTFREILLNGGRHTKEETDELLDQLLADRGRFKQVLTHSAVVDAILHHTTLSPIKPFALETTEKILTLRAPSVVDGLLKALESPATPEERRTTTGAQEPVGGETNRPVVRHDEPTDIEELLRPRTEETRRPTPVEAARLQQMNDAQKRAYFESHPAYQVLVEILKTMPNPAKGKERKIVERTHEATLDRLRTIILDARLGEADRENKIDEFMSPFFQLAADGLGSHLLPKEEYLNAVLDAKKSGLREPVPFWHHLAEVVKDAHEKDGLHDPGSVNPQHPEQATNAQYILKEKLKGAKEIKSVKLGLYNFNTLLAGKVLHRIKAIIEERRVKALMYPGAKLDVKRLSKAKIKAEAKAERRKVEYKIMRKTKETEHALTNEQHQFLALYHLVKAHAKLDRPARLWLRSRLQQKLANTYAQKQRDANQAFVVHKERVEGVYRPDLEEKKQKLAAKLESNKRALKELVRTGGLEEKEAKQKVRELERKTAQVVGQREEQYKRKENLLAILQRNLKAVDQARKAKIYQG